MTQAASNPKQLVIISGKGGTGKTSVTAAFAQLNSRAKISTVLVDADVDASNLGLMMDPYDTKTSEFNAGEKAVIDQEACQSCGLCKEVCRFSAIDITNINENGRKRTMYSVDAMTCEGCAACKVVCPYDAILMEKQKAGVWCQSNSIFGPFFHASLFPGEENSGKLVTLIKQQARMHALQNGQSVILVDGPPGIGCPVIAAFAGADLALIVTEATLSGLHDLERILKTVRHFKLQAIVCINKADLYPQGSEDIRQYAKRENIEIAGEIPYDAIFVEAVLCGMPVTNFVSDSPAIKALEGIWKRTLVVLNGESQHAV